MSGKFYIMLASVFVLLAMFVPASADYKIKQRMKINGQTVETTILVKGSRQRSETSGMAGMGGDVATVEQCDMKRNLQINDGKKLYFIEPFDDATGGATTTGGKTSNEKTTRGGTVTLLYNITDTGERKQMFGLTARHLKTTMTMQASPNACTEADMNIETDGWYVDLPSFSCPVQPAKNPLLGMGGDDGCQDKFVSKQTGSGKLGFPLTETRTMKMGDGEDAVSFTQSVETVEFSNTPLDAKMFDIPAGYTLAKSSQDLYGKPGMSQMIQNSRSNSDDNEDTPKTSSKTNSMNSSMSNAPVGKKKAGVIRIGVYAPTNKSGENISNTNMQTFLIQKLTGKNVEAVSISSDADAKSASCDYILSSDFSKLKQSAGSKIGGMFGKVTGADTSSSRNYDAQVDFKLISLNGSQTAAQNKATSKSESDLDRAAESVLNLEAAAILKAINQ